MKLVNKILKSEAVLTVSLLLFTLVFTAKIEAQTYSSSPEELRKLSYSLGYLNGKSAAMGDYEAFYESINVRPYLKGLKDNIKSPNLVDSCRLYLDNPYIQVGDSMELMDLSILSECQGRFLGSTYCAQIMDEKLESEIDMDQFYLGFEQNILQLQSSYSESEMQESVEKFVEALSKKDELLLAQNDAELLKRTSNWKKPKKLDNGIIINTLKKGKGKARPTSTDDVTAHYMVIDNQGNKMDDSYERGAPMTVNLGNLIEGWQIGLGQMQKGGKYEMYLPASAAYNQGSLLFTIELIDFGPAGSLVKEGQ